MENNLIEQLEKYIFKQEFKSYTKCIEFLTLIGFSIEESYNISSEIFDSRIKIDTEGLKNEELFFIECLNGCEIKIDKVQCSDYILYIKKNEIWFVQDLKNERFWCSYDKVWSIFETKYQWNFQQIQAFIKNMLEKHLELRGVKPNHL